MKILACGAHPDDIEFMCAGTLFLLKQKGHKIALLNINNGSCGSATLSPEEIRKIRREESLKAASLLGADYFSLEIPDLESVFDNQTRRATAEIFRVIQPDIVLTHYPQDYMSDHEMASLLARDASFTSALRNYPTYAKEPAPILPHIPYLYYWSPLEGLNYFGECVNMNIVIDISTVIEDKVQMLSCHASQREWLRKQHGMDEYIEFMKRESARMGKSKGFAYGEGFSQHLGHAYPKDNILLKLLT